MWWLETASFLYLTASVDENYRQLSWVFAEFLTRPKPRCWVKMLSSFLEAQGLAFFFHLTQVVGGIIGLESLFPFLACSQEPLRVSRCHLNFFPYAPSIFNLMWHGKSFLCLNSPTSIFCKPWENWFKRAYAMRLALPE